MKYREYTSTEISICYDDDDKRFNPKEIPIGSPQRDELDYKGYGEDTVEVFCPYHKRWEWKGESHHWK